MERLDKPARDYLLAIARRFEDHPRVDNFITISHEMADEISLKLREIALDS